MAEVNETLGLDPLETQLAVWGPSIDGQEICRLHSKCKERVSGDEWDEIVQTAAFILGRCPRPTESVRSITGLALGKVQSGKTLSYTALIGLAIDNGYRITVVLAGTKKALLLQNYTRLCQDLDAGGQNVTPFENPHPQDAEVIQGVLHSGGHALIVVLKNRQRLDGVIRMLATPELQTVPTLIIDDEGDEASLNTKFRHSKKSPIYNCILALRNVLKVHAYVAYTATPQANLLISSIDDLSPDFGVLVEPGKGYCGGSIFFGCDRERFLRQIPLLEAEDEHVSRITDALKKAVAIFLVGGAIRHLREPRALHSMLIHTSNLRSDHEELERSVRFLITLWKECLHLPNADPAAQELLGLMEAAYDDLCTTVQSPPPWEKVQEGLRHEIWLVELWMVNSLPLGRDPIGTPFRVKNNILIGGNMLGRGVTIDGLAVTYITRRAKNETNADTMEQRARWYGYKQNYLDFCRIFVTAQLRDDYTELLRHEDDFWEALRRNQRQALSIRKWPRMLSLDTKLGLSPTRSNVASFRQFRGGGWDIQNKLVGDEQIAGCNLQVVRSFFDKHSGDMRWFGNVSHLIVGDCPTERVITELLAAVRPDGTDWDSDYSSEYLMRLLLKGVLPSLDVVFMSGGQTRARTARSGRVNPMQGRSPNRNLSDPAFYAGDENIHNGRVQLQVHIIQLRGEGVEHPIETTALALFIPHGDQRFDLSLIVGD